jgi:negative regulator of sigma E activity
MENPVDPRDESLLQDLLDGRLPADEAALVRARLAGEQELREAFDELGRVGDLVRELPTPALPADFLDRVRQGVLAAAGAGARDGEVGAEDFGHPLADAPPVRAAPSPWFGLPRALAMAATVALAFGIGWLVLEPPRESALETARVPSGPAGAVEQAGAGRSSDAAAPAPPETSAEIGREVVLERESEVALERLRGLGERRAGPADATAVPPPAAAPRSPAPPSGGAPPPPARTGVAAPAGAGRPATALGVPEGAAGTPAPPGAVYLIEAADAAEGRALLSTLVAGLRAPVGRTRVHASDDAAPPRDAGSAGPRLLQADARSAEARRTALVVLDLSLTPEEAGLLDALAVRAESGERTDERPPADRGRGSPGGEQGTPSGPSAPGVAERGRVRVRVVVVRPEPSGR